MNIRKKIFIVLLLVVLVIIGGYCYTNTVSTKNNYIEKVLKQKAYSYLPLQAKNYVRQVYEETGEVILTEKNKEENTPYLNPKYVEYLELNNEKKENVDLIPNVYSLDYSYSDNLVDENQIPPIYDSRSVDGKNFVTPTRNQGSLGLCWAVTAIEVAESGLLKSANESYNNSQLFSVRQLDYAYSNNGIIDYTNKFGHDFRKLTTGGNFGMSSEIMSYGLSLVDDKFMPYDESTEKKELNNVINFGNSLYELTASINLPNLANAFIYDSNNDDKIKQCEEEYDYESCIRNYALETYPNYLNVIKKGIMDYGSASVETVSPGNKCGFKNIDGSYALFPDSNCYSIDDAHAMQVIGWNDDYEYEYCKEEKTNSSLVNGKCSSGTKVSGKGAWTLRNSWGAGNIYEYVYLPYDAIIGSDVPKFDFITSLSPMEKKTWNNVYPSDTNSTVKVTRKNITKTFEKKIDGKEKIEKIKLTTSSFNTVFSVSVSSNNEVYNIDQTYNVEYPGVYTLDLSNESIVVEDDFSVKIKALSGYIYDDPLSVFTSNIDKNIIISTEDIHADSSIFRVYSDTKNINSNEEIDYELYDKNNRKINIDVSNNYIAANNINTTISIVDTIHNGDYILKIGYNGNYYDEVKVTFTKAVNLDGYGTENSPYLIHNMEELSLIKDADLGAYYKLVNDIELTDDWNPIGTSDKPFTGCFDGDNHKIINMKISDKNLEYGGLFGFVSNSQDHDTYIKNISFENVDIKSINVNGTLIGSLVVNTSLNNNINIDSIFMNSGKTTGNTVGTLIGNINSKDSTNMKVNISIDRIFSNLQISNSLYSGIIGDTSLYKCSSAYAIKMSDIQNMGVTNSSDSDSLKSYNNAMIGYYGDSGHNVKINNFITTSYTKSDKLIFNHLGLNSAYLTNGYYLKQKDNRYIYSNDNNNVVSVDSSLEMTDKTSYSNWDNFEDNWIVETIDGKTRIPVLKGAEFQYTKTEEFEINVGDEVSLLNYIKPETNAFRIKYELNKNEDIIKVDNEYQSNNSYPSDIKIKGLKDGVTSIHIISDFDGYENDINVKVIDENKKTLHFDSNGGTGKMLDVSVSLEDNMIDIPKNKFSLLGYKFKEWNTNLDGSGDTYFDESTIILEENITLYAIWTPIKYNIYLYNTENEVVGAYLNRYYDKEYIMDNGQEQFALKPGYKFKEWNTNLDGSGDSYNAGDAYKNLSTKDNFSFNLYSILSPITYKIKFDSNGGVGDMDDKLLTYDVGASLSKNLFKNGNHRFKEWNTKSDGSGTSYKDGQDVKNLTDTDNYVITLYAIWEDDTGLKYDYNEDGIIDLLDVKQLFRIYMVTVDREDEEFVSKHDINNDGIVDLLDVKQFFRLVMLGTYD